MRPFSIVTILLVAVFACGCAAEPAVRAPSAEQAPEITRDVAVGTARRDAAARFGDRWISYVDAQNVGRYWMVELRGPDGRGVRYAISRGDGTIRQRTTVQ